MDRPRLRDAKHLATPEVYPLNEFSRELIARLDAYFVYLVSVGRTDISGGDWSDAFAWAVGGNHLDSPLGIADVVLGRQCWSMKTVKSKAPIACTAVRLISGRCSPDYSYGIHDPSRDVQATGDAVLRIWNERLNIAYSQYSQVRTTVLVRGEDMLTHCLFEEDAVRYRPSDYVWSVNRNGNYEGMDASGRKRFTWQPHGAQFTIHVAVPPGAVKFRLKAPPKQSVETVLKGIGFNESWIDLVA